MHSLLAPIVLISHSQTRQVPSYSNQTLILTLNTHTLSAHTLAHLHPHTHPLSHLRTPIPMPHTLTHTHTLTYSFSHHSTHPYSCHMPKLTPHSHAYAHPCTRTHAHAHARTRSWSANLLKSSSSSSGVEASNGAARKFFVRARSAAATFLVESDLLEGLKIIAGSEDFIICCDGDEIFWSHSVS